ncbi:hypothetical protein N9954_09850 [Maribacter sp.]|nr:hypothetical protein [Maribacter sp.]
MKKILFTLISVMVFNIGFAFTYSTTSHEPKSIKILTSQIYTMLGENIIPNEIRGAKAEMRIAVDAGNHLRILSIESDNEGLKNFLKSSIDFKKIRKGTYKQGIVYRIPIEVRK